MTQEMRIYLNYADEVERCDPIMAAACRTYYVEYCISQKKREGSTIFSNKENAELEAVFRKIEAVNTNTGFNPEQRKQRAYVYCTRMYNKIVDSIKAPGFNKIQALDNLITLMNFIQVLTIFGPLEAIWVKNCKFAFHE